VKNNPLRWKDPRGLLLVRDWEFYEKRRDEGDLFSAWGEIIVEQLQPEPVYPTYNCDPSLQSCPDLTDPLKKLPPINQCPNQSGQK
jgi:hypothetical protein